MKIIQKHHINNRNESGAVMLSPYETNQLLTTKIKNIAFSSTNPIGYKFSKIDSVIVTDSFTSDVESPEIYISNVGPDEVRVQYSCIHYS